MTVGRNRDRHGNLTDIHSNIAGQDNDYTNFSASTYNGVRVRQDEEADRERRIIYQTRMHHAQAFRATANGIDPDTMGLLGVVLSAIRGQMPQDITSASANAANAPASITEAFQNSTAGQTFSRMFGGFVPAGTGAALDRSARGLFGAASGAVNGLLRTAGGKVGALLELIGDKEAGGNYNRIFDGAQRHFNNFADRHFNGRDLSEMTVGEVLRWQRAARADGMASTAAGKYQIIFKTLNGLVDSMGISPNARFDEALQDRMAMKLLEGRGLNSFLAGRMPAHEFQNNIAREWASMPRTDGRGQYDDDGLNRVGTTSQVVQSTLNRIAPALSLG